MQKQGNEGDFENDHYKFTVINTTKHKFTRTKIEKKRKLKQHDNEASLRRRLSYRVGFT